MPRGGKRPGAGRPKGSPNRITSAAREAFLATFGKLEGELEGWIRRTAEEDPAKASDILLRMAEYHFPRLGRTEVTGEGGGAIVFRMEDE